MQIMYDNKTVSATKTAYTENPNYLLANLDYTQLSRRYRSVGASDQWIVFTGPIKASRLMIAAHNLSVDAEIYIQGNNTNAWTAPSFSQELSYKSGIITGQFVEATYNYWRLYINDDGSNSPDYIEIGGLYLGTYVQLPGMKIDQKIDNKTTSMKSLSQSGQLYGDKRYKYRSFTVNFPAITNAQKAEITTMWESMDITDPFYLLIWANREDMETPIYCCFNYEAEAGPTWTHTENYTHPWAVSLNIREVF